MKYVTSDLHFGHENIIKYCDRKDRYGRTYESAMDMDADILNRINSVVGPGDNLYIIGDVCMMSLEDAVDILKAINCQLYLIAGNHDTHLRHQEFRDCFVWVKQIKSVKMMPDTQAMVMCHYPILSWNNMARGALHLHGHCHGKLEPSLMHPARIDVGWDAHGKVLNYYDIMEIHKEQLGLFWNQQNVDGRTNR